jgi:hypothetical protein
MEREESYHMKNIEILKELIDILYWDDDFIKSLRNSTAHRLRAMYHRLNAESFQLTPNDIGKFVKTRSGRKAIVLYKYELAKYPYAIYVFDPRDDYGWQTVAADGRCASNHEEGLDVIGYWEE